MRLIDIEPLQNTLYNVHHHEGISLVPMVRLNAVYELIADQPTIDAVPIDWLREKMNTADDAGDLDCVDIISWILQEWQKEQEAR